MGIKKLQNEQAWDDLAADGGLPDGRIVPCDASAVREERMTYIDIVFDGPPSHESGRFVEVENPLGHSINAGEWIDRGNGLWALRIGLSAAAVGKGASG